VTWVSKERERSKSTKKLFEYSFKCYFLFKKKKSFVI